MSEQARALALAARLKESTSQAAAELRRLHEEKIARRWNTDHGELDIETWAPV